MSNLYHPVTGEYIKLDELDNESAFIEDRLFKPEVWIQYYVDEEDQNNQTYGIEIELNTDTSCSEKRVDICKELLAVLNRDGKHFHIMRDNSVRNGIEIVSAPMTYKYWVNNFDVLEINELFEKLNLTATVDTGLHIHVGIQHTQRIRELFIQLFAISYPMWVYLSDRRVRRIQDRYVSTRYFFEKNEVKDRFIDTVSALNYTGKSLVDYYGISYYDYQFDDRYTGLNFYNEKTIEFRMFAGTNNFFDIFKYLALVNTISTLADDISHTRVNNVFNLDTFVERTQSELMLEETVRYIRFINDKLNKNRIYYNEFMYLDSHWYRVPLKNLKRKDFALEKSVYDEYLVLLKKFNESSKAPESLNYKHDIDNLLVNNLIEVVKDVEEDDFISLINVRGNTDIMEVSLEESNRRYVFLRGINSSLILKKPSLKNKKGKFRKRRQNT